MTLKSFPLSVEYYLKHLIDLRAQVASERERAKRK